jgi:hypothetical protein
MTRPIVSARLQGLGNVGIGVRSGEAASRIAYTYAAVIKTAMKTTLPSRGETERERISACLIG